MAKGPKGERRPADGNARAVMIAKIATGEVEGVSAEDGKNAAAVALGCMGGRAKQKACRPKDARRSPKRLPRNAGKTSKNRTTPRVAPLLIPGNCSSSLVESPGKLESLSPPL